jgi:hypothetical protein
MDPRGAVIPVRVASAVRARFGVMVCAGRSALPAWLRGGTREAEPEVVDTQGRVATTAHRASSRARRTTRRRGAPGMCRRRRGHRCPNTTPRRCPACRTCPTRWVACRRRRGSARRNCHGARRCRPACRTAAPSCRRGKRAPTRPRSAAGQNITYLEYRHRFAIHLDHHEQSVQELTRQGDRAACRVRFGARRTTASQAPKILSHPQTIT